MVRNLMVLAICLLAAVAFGGVAVVSAQGADKGSGSAGTNVEVAPEGCPIAFADVPPNSTFYSYVTCLACRGIVGGYSCGGPGEPCGVGNLPYFRPNANVTRGQLSKIVAASAGYNNDPGLQLFEDVLPGSTYYTPVNQLTQFGFINGYDCGGIGEPCSPQHYRYFRPNAPASRGQIAKIITQAVGWYDTVNNQIFQDVPLGSTFFDEIGRLYMHNAVSGYPCGGVGEPCVGPGNLPYFHPNANVTRGQLSKIDVTAFFPSCLTQNKRE